MSKSPLPVGEDGQYLFQPGSGAYLSTCRSCTEVIKKAELWGMTAPFPIKERGRREREGGERERERERERATLRARARACVRACVCVCVCVCV